MLWIIIQRRVPFTELSSEAARATAVPPDHQSSLELRCSVQLWLRRRSTTEFMYSTTESHGFSWMGLFFVLWSCILKKNPTTTWIMTLKYRFLILVWVSGCWWNDYHWNKKPRYRHSQWMQDFKTLLTQANGLFAILASGDANTGWRQRQRSRGRVAPGRGP